MELIEVDGRWYNEDLNEVLNPQPKSVTLMGVTLTEGECYDNYFGHYAVRSISDDEKTMTVRYLTVNHAAVRVGEEKTYPVAAQVKTLANEKRRARVKLASVNAMEFVGDKDADTLAFIKEYGSIDVTVPEHRQELFRIRYIAVAGHPPEDHFGGGFHHTECKGWWGDTMRVYLPLPEPEVANKLALPEEGVRIEGNTIIVSNNSFVWGLFHRGFEIGRNNENMKARTGI